MSLWTPSGEHEVNKGEGAPQGGGAGDPGTRRTSGVRPPDSATGEPGDAPDPAAAEELRRQLVEAPAEVVVANHCYGLFELAAVYLSQTPPLLEQARLAIDALGHLVDGLGPRLGEPAASLQDALAQIRIAYVQLDAAASEAAPPGGPNGSGASPG